MKPHENTPTKSLKRSLPYRIPEHDCCGPVLWCLNCGDATWCLGPERHLCLTANGQLFAVLLPPCCVEVLGRLADGEEAPPRDPSYDEVRAQSFPRPLFTPEKMTLESGMSEICACGHGRDFHHVDGCFQCDCDHFERAY